MYILPVRNECQIDNFGHTPCQNGGICVDRVREYQCICIGNYEGTNYQEEGNIHHYILVE